MFWKLLVANTIAIITVTIINVCIIIGRFLYTMTESERLCLMQHYWQHFATSLEGCFIRSIRLYNQTLSPLHDNHNHQSIIISFACKGIIGRFLCTMTGVLPVLFSFVSSFTIICISLDRFFESYQYFLQLFF